MAKAQVVKNPKAAQQSKVVTARVSVSEAKAMKQAEKKAAKSEEAVGLSIGVKTGLKVHAFVGYLLGENGKKDWHCTDEQLTEMFHEEFPQRGHCQPFSRFRGWYNCGTYSKMGLAPGGEPCEENGVRPEEKSVAYDENGEQKKRAGGFKSKADQEAEAEEAAAPTPKKATVKPAGKAKVKVAPPKR